MLVVEIHSGEVGLVPLAIVLGLLGNATIGVVLIVVDSGLLSGLVAVVPPAAALKNLDGGVSEQAHP